MLCLHSELNLPHALFYLQPITKTQNFKITRHKMLFLHQQGAYFCVLCNVFLKKLTETEQVEDKRRSGWPKRYQKLIGVERGGRYSKDMHLALKVMHLLFT